MRQNLRFSLYFFLLGICYSTDAYQIALCTVATGKYAQFVKPWIESARRNFLSDHQIKYYIFTDQFLPVDGDDVEIFQWPHKRWPFSSMMRFDAYLSKIDQIQADYFFASDVDRIFNDLIGDEILGDLVGTLHPGYYKKDLFKSGEINSLIENNPGSAIYTSILLAKNEYFAGGFYGGRKCQFKKLLAACSATLHYDLERGLISNWHDETHLNYFFRHNQPTIKLDPRYCFPEDGSEAHHYRHIKDLSPKVLITPKYKIGSANCNDDSIRNFACHYDEREFVILIPSYNNKRYYERNLGSVYAQDYPRNKFRIIYVDDCSPDGTGAAVSDYVNKRGKQSHTKVIKNSERHLALANIYNTIHQQCYDHEIVVILDGDDEFAHPNVLRFLNDVYSKNDIWMTYGNCWLMVEGCVCSWSKAIDDKQIELNNFREWDGAATHLRTFYASLFKKIHKTDLMISGDFFKMTYDVAMFMPMLEMSGFHHKFIKDVLYNYNDENPINDHKINAQMQLDLNRYIRHGLSKYHPITKTVFFEKLFSINDKGCNPHEIAGLVNDFIANLRSIFPENDVLEICQRVPYLRRDVSKNLNLSQIAIQKNYTHLTKFLCTANY